MTSKRRHLMPDHESVEREPPRRGVAIKLLGVVLIILGTLDSMLSWRGGFALSETYVLLIAAGIFLYAIGAIGLGAERDPQPSPGTGEDRPLDLEIDLSQRDGQVGSYHGGVSRVLQQTLQVERDSSGSEQPQARSGADGSS